MNTVALCSVRGGSGVTSIAAMLGDALNLQGVPVCLIDLNPSDLLRLHFNLPLAAHEGTDNTHALTLPWYERAYEVRPDLVVLPYGAGLRASENSDHAAATYEFWMASLGRLHRSFAWVLFDLPVHGRGYGHLFQACDLSMLVVQPDMPSHVLLAQSILRPGARMLLNKWNPEFQLESDVVLDWHHRYGEQLIPVHIFHDENIHEALAHQQTVNQWCPGSIGAQGASALAQWCLQEKG